MCFIPPRAWRSKVRLHSVKRITDFEQKIILIHSTGLVLLQTHACVFDVPWHEPTGGKRPTELDLEDLIIGVLENEFNTEIDELTCRSIIDAILHVFDACTAGDRAEVRSWVVGGW